ncbi:FtsJ-like methyltransferase-domain-containing protein [Limtongia smithiae]|uniref:FtsJ-like methyltransferase-domain-containing protein n=1 Tax=Limtongia smithiae TaxID=1125753 RepID=UPI0034CD1611
MPTPRSSSLGICGRRRSRFIFPLHDDALALSTAASRLPLQATYSSSASSHRWKRRQHADHFVQESKEQGLLSRAAFKLIEIDEKHKLFKPAQTVIDLGFSPGSWTQVVVDRTAPNGKVIGVDIQPTRPPEGATAVHGDFLRADTLERLRVHIASLNARGAAQNESPSLSDSLAHSVENSVDVVLSDMLMNTSGVAFRDHSRSMDLSHAAYAFALQTLKPGGSFVCKFLTGQEDKLLESLLRKGFAVVKRLKPEASRRESRENYFVCLKRRHGVSKNEVYNDDMAG